MKPMANHFLSRNQKLAGWVKIERKISKQVLDERSTELSENANEDRFISGTATPYGMGKEPYAVPTPCNARLHGSKR